MVAGLWRSARECERRHGTPYSSGEGALSDNGLVVVAHG